MLTTKGQDAVQYLRWMNTHVSNPIRRVQIGPALPGKPIMYNTYVCAQIRALYSGREDMLLCYKHEKDEHNSIVKRYHRLLLLALEEEDPLRPSTLAAFAVTFSIPSVCAALLRPERGAALSDAAAAAAAAARR